MPRRISRCELGQIGWRVTFVAVFIISLAAFVFELVCGHGAAAVIIMALACVFGILAAIPIVILALLTLAFRLGSGGWF